MEVEHYLKPPKRLSVEEKVFNTQFKTDENNSHLAVDQEICRQCEHKICTTICPVGNYTLDEQSGDIVVSFEGCLECGTCRVACDKGSISWRFPRGGYGVFYRFG